LDDDKHRAITSLPDVQYVHPRHGVVCARCDEVALKASGRVFASASVGQSLAHIRHVESLYGAARIIGNTMFGRRLIWGVSGFAARGYELNAEAKGMSRVFNHLARSNERPALIVDGGSSQSVLGLSGILAKKHSFTSVGFTALQGMASMAPRDLMVFSGTTYQSREELIGLTADILLCFGGGEGTRRECLANLYYGGVSVVFALKDYPADMFAGEYRNRTDKTEEELDGRLIICRSVRDIPHCLDAAIQKSWQIRNGVKSHKTNRLNEILLNE
jgi:predicted Rossmann-fold nucleotide-binding protein